MELLRVDIANGKYKVVQEEDGSVVALRYGEKWRDCTGDKLILALAQELEKTKDELQQVREELLDSGR